MDWATEGPKPYTVTNTEFCEGTDVIAECTWSYLVEPNQLDQVSGVGNFRLNFLSSHGNNADATIVINYEQDGPTDGDDWKDCDQETMDFISARMPSYLYRVNTLSLCEYQNPADRFIYHVQFDLID